MAQLSFDIQIKAVSNYDRNGTVSRKIARPQLDGQFIGYVFAHADTETDADVRAAAKLVLQADGVTWASEV